MRKGVFGWAMAATIALAGCGSKDDQPPADTAGGTIKRAKPVVAGENQAVAMIEPKSGSTVTGAAVFTAKGGQVTLVVDIEGAEPGVHGIHLHENADCASPGEHWNPTGEDHGKMGETPMAHSGDLGNLEVGSDGKGHLEFATKRWTIGGDAKTNVVGRSIVIHAAPDDLKTQPSGESGDGVGCGVIAR